VLLNPGEVLDEAKEIRPGRHAGSALLIVGQPLRRPNSGVTHLVEVDRSTSRSDPTRS